MTKVLPNPTCRMNACSRLNRQAAFTLTELLVVIVILALLVATQLPALTRTNPPSRLALCKNNTRQIAHATMLYRADNNDIFPHGTRIMSMYIVDVPTGWPMQLLRYLGGYTPTNQPTVYFCPDEISMIPNIPFQLHYQANRYVVCDILDCPTGTPGSSVRNSERYWMFMEKSQSHFASTKSGALITDYMMPWNFAGTTTSPGMRRHNGGLAAAAVDGHVEWLRMPNYEPGSPGPFNFVELGDCYTPPNNSPYAPYWANNGPVAKLFCRNTTGGGF